MRINCNQEIYDHRKAALMSANIVFVFIVIDILAYDPILGAYEIVALWEHWCLYHSSIQCYHLFSTIHHGEYGNMYIKSKYDLSVYCNYMTS